MWGRKASLVVSRRPEGHSGAWPTRLDSSFLGSGTPGCGISQALQCWGPPGIFEKCSGSFRLSGRWFWGSNPGQAVHCTVSLRGFLRGNKTLDCLSVLSFFSAAIVIKHSIIIPGRF